MAEMQAPSSVQEIPERGETFQAAREKLNDAAGYADETVRSHPWTFVGVGFGVGVVVGALIALAAGSRARF